MAEVEFDSEHLINAVQNETSLWDSNVNASEEAKELAWKRIADSFGITNGWYTVHCYSNSYHTFYCTLYLWPPYTVVV